MDNQASTPVQPEVLSPQVQQVVPPPPLSQPPQKSRKKLFFVVAIILVVLIAIAVVLVLTHKKQTGSGQASQATGTHSKVYANDLKFGDNRAVNACNVLSEAQVAAQFGASPSSNIVQEKFISADVPISLILPKTGKAAVAACSWPLPNGGLVSLTFDGYRDYQSATADYNYTLKDLAAGITTQPAPGLTATMERYNPLKVEVVGVHNNFRYSLELDSGVDSAQQPTVAPDQQQAGLASLAKLVVANMDNPNVSTRPAAVDTSLAYHGTKQVDACSLFDAQTFEQTILAPNNRLQDFAKHADPAAVSRVYVTAIDQSALQFVGASSCSRQSSPKPIIENETPDQALQDLKDFVKDSISISAQVKVDYYPDAQSAQDYVSVHMANGGQAVSGLSDKAVYSSTGLSGELKQLSVSKGRYGVTILASYINELPTDPKIPEADFIALGKVIVAKLP